MKEASMNDVVIYSSEMKMQQGASERRVYKRKVHTQARSNDAASSFPMSIGVLALQGCVTPHRFHIEGLGAQYKEVRTVSDLNSIHGLILPGGESTAMLKLIKEFELEKALLETAARVPVWGICAGAILMAKTVLSPAQHSLSIMDITIERNAYGSQLNSFNAIIENSPVCFIRAPVIQNLGNRVQIKAKFNHAPVWVQEGHHMACAFHPELASDKPSTIHKYFIKLIVNSMK